MPDYAIHIFTAIATVISLATYFNRRLEKGLDLSNRLTRVEVRQEQFEVNISKQMEQLQKVVIDTRTALLTEIPRRGEVGVG